MSNYRLAVVVVSAALIGGGLYHYGLPNHTEYPKKIDRAQPELAHGFGVIDIDKIRDNHPKSEEIKEIHSREIRLRLELNELMRPVSPPKLPEIDIKPFDRVAHEKNMQSVMERLTELRAKKKRLAEEYRNAEESNYFKRRDAVRDVYLNEALNLTLKIQNAKVLRLTAEELRELQQRLDEVVKERNQRQSELLNEWVTEINAHVEAVTADEEAKLRSEIDALMSISAEDADRKIHEVQERNRLLMEQAAQEIAIRQNRRREITTELKEVIERRENLEEAIFNSIVDKAGMIGAVKHLEMVLIRRESDIAEKYFKFNVEMTFDFPVKKTYGVMIYEGIDTENLTDDLIKSLDNKNLLKE